MSFFRKWHHWTAGAHSGERIGTDGLAPSAPPDTVKQFPMFQVYFLISIIINYTIDVLPWFRPVEVRFFPV